MNLTAVTAELVAISGRKDLENRSLLTGFINEAGEFLQRNFFFSDEGEAVYSTDLAASALHLHIPSARIIREVWVTESDGYRYQLEKREEAWMRKEYGEVIYDATAATSSSPQFYARMTSRRRGTAGTYDKEVDDTGANTYMTIIVMSPPDETVTVSVYGEWDYVALASGTDSNFWSEVHPHILVDAAHMMIERRMGNAEKADALEQFVMQRLQLASDDNLEQSLEDSPIVEG